MKNIHLQLTNILLLVFLFAATVARGQNERNEIVIQPTIRMGMTPPIPVSLKVSPARLPRF